MNPSQKKKKAIKDPTLLEYQNAVEKEPIASKPSTGNNQAIDAYKQAASQNSVVEPTKVLSQETPSSTINTYQEQASKQQNAAYDPNKIYQDQSQYAQSLYQNQIKNIESAKSTALQQEYSSNERIMKYLGRVAANQGQRGVSSGDALEAFAGYQSRVGDIKGTYDQLASEADTNLATNEMSIKQQQHDQMYNEYQLSAQREYEEKMLADERAYQEKIQELDRQWQQGLIKDEREYANQQTEAQRAYEQALLADERAYQERIQQDNNSLVITEQNKAQALYMAQENINNKFASKNQGGRISEEQKQELLELAKTYKDRIGDYVDGNYGYEALINEIENYQTYQGNIQSAPGGSAKEGTDINSNNSKYEFVGPDGKEYVLSFSGDSYTTDDFLRYGEKKHVARAVDFFLRTGKIPTANDIGFSPLNNSMKKAGMENILEDLDKFLSTHGVDRSYIENYFKK